MRLPVHRGKLARRQLAACLMRSERLLHGMHKVLSHDLPNQMVALKGLLQLVELEEAKRLSAEGREYLRRLQIAAARAVDLARFLKEMDRLNTFAIRPETIQLEALGRELEGDLRRHGGDAKVVFNWRWDAPTLEGDPRIFRAAFSELWSVLLLHRGNLRQVTGDSKRRCDNVELSFRLVYSGVDSKTARSISETLEIMLARQWLALTNASLELGPTEGEQVRLSILVADSKNNV